MSSIRFLTFSLLVAAHAVSACRDPTQLLIVVDAVDEVRPRVRETVVWSASTANVVEPTLSMGSFGPEGSTPASFPFSFGVAPGSGGVDEAVFVRVRGLGASGRSERCIRTRFEQNETVLVPVLLTDWCSGEDCPVVACETLDAPCAVSADAILTAPRVCGREARDAGVADQLDAGVLEDAARDGGESVDLGLADDGGGHEDAGVADDGGGLPDAELPKLCGCTADEWVIGSELEVSTATAPLYGASFSADRREIYQSLNDEPRWSLYRRERSATGSDVFGPPERVEFINTCLGFDKYGCVNIRFVTTADGLTAYFGSHRRPHDSLELFRWTRTSTSVPFSLPAASPVPYPVRSPSGAPFAVYNLEEVEPWITTDGSRLYYSATNDPSEDQEKPFRMFYREWDTQREEFDDVEYPVMMYGFSGPAVGRSLSLSPDELILVYYRRVCTADCQQFISFASRPHRDAEFRLEGSLMPDLVGQDVRGASLSADGCEIVYTKGSWPDWRIYKRRISASGGGPCP